MYTVLIVEDEMLVRVGMKNMICWADMNMKIIGEAQDGKQGLELYWQKKPDIILTDIKMPVMDGLEMIKQIRQNDKKTKIVVLSCYEDFELVRVAFGLGISDYILKLKMMPEEIEKIIRKVQGELLSDNAKGIRRNELEKEIPDYEEAAKLYIINRACSDASFHDLANYLHLKESGLLVCVMKLCFSGQAVREKDFHHKEKVRQVIESLVQNILLEYNQGKIWIEAEDRYLILLDGFGGDNEKENSRLLHELLYRIRSVLQSCINQDVVFACSDFSQSYSDLNCLYRKALYLVEVCSFLERSIVVYGDNTIRQEYERTLTDFGDWIVEQKKIEENYRAKIINDIAYLRKSEIIKIELVREMIIRWVHFLTAENNWKQIEIQYAMNIIEQIRESSSLYKMIEIFEECLIEIWQNQEGIKTLTRELAEAISYIDRCFCESSLSLSKVAEEVSLNKDYLSKLFKKELQIGFSDYVNIKRIEKAKELLVQTHMKSYEIALTVGFQDESYFSRVFKKFVSVRPNEYKRQVLTYKDGRKMQEKE